MNPDILIFKFIMETLLTLMTDTVEFLYENLFEFPQLILYLVENVSNMDMFKALINAGLVRKLYDKVNTLSMINAINQDNNKETIEADVIFSVNLMHSLFSAEYYDIADVLELVPILHLKEFLNVATEALPFSCKINLPYLNFMNSFSMKLFDEQTQIKHAMIIKNIYFSSFPTLSNANMLGAQKLAGCMFFICANEKYYCFDEICIFLQKLISSINIVKHEFIPLKLAFCHLCNHLLNCKLNEIDPEKNIFFSELILIIQSDAIFFIEEGIVLYK